MADVSIMVEPVCSNEGLTLGLPVLIFGWPVYSVEKAGGGGL